MGEIFDKLRKSVADRTQGNPRAGVGGGQHSAAYLLAKHRFDQGLGPNPDATGTATPGTPSAPPGGAHIPPSTGGVQIPDDEDSLPPRPRRLPGRQVGIHIQ